MDQSGEPSDDLRTRLHAMESKLRRMREQRNSHNESAKRASDSRNSVNTQGKELREHINSRMEEQKETRARAKIHQARRDEIQKSIRELVSRKKGKRDDGPGKSVVIQLSETVGEIERIENRIMTDGTLSLEKENSLIKKLKSLISRRDELIPEVENHQIISIDLSDMDESIQKLRAEADNEHGLMIEQNKLADKIWSEIKPMLEERDFLRGEGDRLHSIFLEERAKADEIHQDIVEMLSKVNEIRDELRSQHEKRERIIREHNESVRQALRGPDEDDELAESLSERLLEGDSIKFGGIVSSESHEQQTSIRPKKRTTRKLGTSRGRKR
ncbi:MAG: hypothetical protein CMB67_04305 [Euryarchaeota archaeon]|nr:hypothetical protein [Euryarchaeota archaeon]